MASYLDTLNEEQRKFVLHEPGSPNLLLAGAGSGKTHAAKTRVMHLITNGVESRRICVLTFTNKAANEINERVIKATNINPDLAPTMSTIHSLALRFIRKNPAGFGLGNKISPADDYDQTKLLEAIVQRKEWDINHYNLKDKIDFHRARGVGFRIDYTDEVHKAAQKAHAGYHAMDPLELEAWELFEQEKTKNNLVDFADMIYLVNRRMVKDLDWAGKVHRMYHHILMDEAQDTNIPCWQFVNNLMGPTNFNLSVIGDLAQSIYAFNGAMPELILDYSRNWRGVTPVLYRLQRNHRSVSKVVDFANKIQALMVDSLPLQMISHRAEQGDDTGAVRLIRAESTQDAAYNVVRQISDGRGTLRDYAILVRSSMQIREIEGALVSARIPYIVRGGRGLLQTEEIRDILAYIRLACNPNDFSALMRAASAPKRGLGEVALEKIRANANALYEGDLIRGCQKAGGKAEIFGNQMREIANEVTNPLRALDTALATTMYKDYIRKKYAKDLEKVKNKLENIDRLRVMIEGMLAESDMTTEDLVFQLSMEKVPEDDERGAVTISTIHSAKGLEWKTVFVWSVVEGCLPHWRSSGDEKELTEERRLFYVAVTRARDYAYLCVPNKVPRGQNMSFAEMSRFLIELGVKP
jgi:DNA helicase-2/ATP-dependent DNA helicase PcrA